MSTKRKVYRKEYWKPIKGTDGFYEVSNLGRVRSTERDVSVVMTRGGNQYSEVRHYKSKILNYVYPVGGGRMYPYVHLKDKHHNRYTVQVRKIVADTFLDGDYSTKQIRYIDNDPDNCSLYNLEVVL